MLRQRARAARPTVWAAVGVVLVVTGVAVVLSRPGTDGPLGGAYAAGVVVEAFPAGSVVTYGLQSLTMDDDTSGTVELLSVEPILGSPAVDVVGEVMVLGQDRIEQLGAGGFDVLPGWPPERTEPQPVRDAILTPGLDGNVQVVLPVRVPSLDEPIGRIDGFVVEYRANGRRYRETFDTVLVLCPVEDNSRCREFAKTL